MVSFHLTNCPSALGLCFTVSFNLQFITQHAIFTLEMSAALLCFKLQTKYDMEIGFLDNKNNKTDIV